jgi:N-acetylneuraminate synthase/N,N'-diacetyllegionaminate synthase
MIVEAKTCGADIVKFQLYDTDRIKKPWQSRYFELKVAELTKEDLRELKKVADKVGIEFMASAFDPERVQWLEDIGVKRHKLASRSIYDTNLIKAMEKTGKPIIVSLGEWKGKNFPKIKNASFLYCVSEYPAYIKELPKFDKYVGFSDHTIGCYWAREAVKRGAQIIEKHFTLNKTLPGHNQKGSAEPFELKDLVAYARQNEKGIAY